MKNKKGMTYTEVIIALALLTLSIGGILGVLVQSASTGKSIDYTYVATNLARSKIERLREVRRDKGYTTLAGMAGTSNETIDRHGESDGEFKRTTIIANPAADLTQITVQVKYIRGGTLMPVSTELVTYVSPYYD